jgi:hypothetical protein
MGGTLKQASPVYVVLKRFSIAVIGISMGCSKRK